MPPRLTLAGQPRLWSHVRGVVGLPSAESVGGLIVSQLENCYCVAGLGVGSRYYSREVSYACTRFFFLPFVPPMIV